MGEAMIQFRSYLTLIARTIALQVSTGMYLEEFKTTRGSLRSVEEYSFSQLEMINSHGKYQVGCLKSHGSSSRPVCTTDDCVELVIEVQREACPVSGKVYRLSDLLDLQSKLMLISRQSDKSKTDQVHVFVQVRVVDLSFFVCCSILLG